MECDARTMLRENRRTDGQTDRRGETVLHKHVEYTNIIYKMGAGAGTSTLAVKIARLMLSPSPPSVPPTPSPAFTPQSVLLYNKCSLWING